MSVASGPIGKESVHYVAPEADRVESEMAEFFTWLHTEKSLDPLIKASIAHVRFVMIHPFDDGNGRIARSITDAIMAENEKDFLHFYSLTQEIIKNKNRYYNLLDIISKGSFDLTNWIRFQMQMFRDAIHYVEWTINDVLHKKAIWDAARKIDLNFRQKKILEKMLDNFEGKLTEKKYCKICRCKLETAQADLLELVNAGVMYRNEKEFILKS